MQEWNIAGAEQGAGPPHLPHLPATQQGISGKRKNNSLEVGLETAP